MRGSCETYRIASGILYAGKPSPHPLPSPPLQCVVRVLRGTWYELGTQASLGCAIFVTLYEFGFSARVTGLATRKANAFIRVRVRLMIERFITLASTPLYGYVLQSVKPNVTHKSWIGYNKAKCSFSPYSATTDTFLSFSPSRAR